MMKKETAISICNVKKKYRLGQIGGGSLQADLQSWWAKKRGKEDPNSVIGQKERLVGQTFMALNGIDLTVYKGEALGIIGSNGAGKSTLLKLLSRVTAPSEGTIDLYGRVASMLEVGTGFHAEMTGRENIYMNGAILGMTKAEIDAKMDDIIEFSEVRDFIDTPVKRYSSGMYVKLAFSVSAHLDSEIMIMDEVLAVGDMAFQKKCLNKMKEAATKDGRTILYVSHNMNTIRQLCSRCVVLDQGRIVYDGDVEKAIEVYLGTANTLGTAIKYEKSHHSHGSSSNLFVIKELELPGCESACFNSGEKTKVEIRIESGKKWEKVSFRFEIHYQDGSTVGTMLSSSTVDIHEGVNTVTLELDLSHLTPGRYSADIIAYEYNEFGNEHLIDAVYPGIMWEISSELTQENSLIWLHNYWGHVHLHDLKIIGD